MAKPPQDPNFFPVFLCPPPLVGLTLVGAPESHPGLQAGVNAAKVAEERLHLLARGGRLVCHPAASRGAQHPWVPRPRPPPPTAGLCALSSGHPRHRVAPGKAALCAPWGPPPREPRGPRASHGDRKNPVGTPRAPSVPHGVPRSAPQGYHKCLKGTPSALWGPQKHPMHPTGPPSAPWGHRKHPTHPTGTSSTP